MVKKRICISGAGISGISLAILLDRSGHDVTIIEKSACFKPAGYVIWLQKQGVDILAELGVLQAVKERAINVDESRWIKKDSSLMRTIDIAAETDVDRGGLVINRGDLHQALYDAARRTLNIRFGTTLANVSEDKDVVNVEFSDGLVDQFDLLVGADGIHSVTRELVFGGGFEHYLNISVMAFHEKDFTGSSIIDENISYNSLQNDFYGVILQHKEGLGCSVFYKNAPGKLTDINHRHQKMHALVNSAGDRFKHSVNTLQDEDSIFHDDLYQVRMPSWSSGRVVLLGDAAFALTAMSGRGTGMALLGAHVLETAISRYEDHSVAFGHYEKRLRKGITALQKMAEGYANWLMSTDWDGRSFFGFVFKLMPNWLLRLASERDMLREY